jgi:aspartyl-tRNA(Asn)/glutamyl-tRNA(Gln) amidotransferase subunit A
LIPTEGVFPLAASLDHVGPMARSVEDLGLMFGAMAGGRARAARTLAAIDRKPKRFRLAISEYFLRDVDPEIVGAIEAAVKVFEKQGARIVSAEIPELEEALEASRVIVLAEAINYHEPLLRQNREGYGPLVRSRLEGGYALTALQLVRAEERRLELMFAANRLFREVDCLIGAVLPVAAPPIGTQQLTLGSRELSLAEAFCHYNAPQNLIGSPALSLPCGLTRAGLPIALQLVGGLGRDAELLGLGAAYQRATDWHRLRPRLTD